MSWIGEFKAFALKGNVIDLAVGVVIGGAFGKIVSALVDDVIMPLVSAMLPGSEWREFTLTPLKFKVGHLLGATLDFLIIAAVLFLVVQKLMGVFRRHDAAPAAPTTKSCPECLETIPIMARRCRACTAPLTVSV
jgi:large conductance mechanosensitive channel